MVEGRIPGCVLSIVMCFGMKKSTRYFKAVRYDSRFTWEPSRFPGLREHSFITCDALSMNRHYLTLSKGLHVPAVVDGAGLGRLPGVID